LDRVIGQAKGRILLTTFASSVHRVNMVLLGVAVPNYWNRTGISVQIWDSNYVARTL